MKLYNFFQVPEDENMVGIIDKIKQLDTSIEQTSVNVKRLSQSLEKYGDLPPNILMAKAKVADAEAKYKELNDKINKCVG